MKQLFGIRRILFLILFLTFGILIAEAKKNPDDYHAIIEMSDGTIFEGYVMTSLKNYFNPKVTKVGISKEFEGETKKYSSDEIKSITYPPIESDTTTVIYHSVKAKKQLPNLLNKNPKPYKEPVFLRLVYEGKHVKGYALPLFDAVHGGTMSVYNYTWRYFYKTDDSDVAVAYWDDIGGIFPALKKFMKLLFREFPEIQKMIDNGTLKPGEFRDNCLIVLPIIDEIIEQRNLKP
ncbi:MAG: hypothetical protein K2L89_04855 [Muribaculaceae bacterium]|nr:hypothetical protein [Muribaculaceae bacterium]